MNRPNGEGDRATAIALRVAFRAFDAPETSDAERDAILTAMETHLPQPESELAAKISYHRSETKKQQMLLRGLYSK